MISLFHAKGFLLFYCYYDDEGNMSDKYEMSSLA